MSTTHGACDEVTLLKLRCCILSAQIQIPCIGSAVAEDYVYEYCNIYGAVLSANPSLTSDYVLVTVSTYEGSSILASWRSGDLKWTKIGNVAYVNTMLFYKGEFYVVYDTHEVWGFDSAGPSISHPRKLVSLKDFVDFGCLMIEYFLVEVSGVLLLLVIKIFSVTDCENDMKYETSKFEVYAFDVIKGELKQINTLGESAIFLDCRCPRSMCASSIGSSKFAGVKPSHIYITNDWRQKFYCFKVSDYEKFVGAYNLEDGKVEPYCGLSLCPFSTLTWVTPSFR